MKGKKILIIEDDQDLAKVLSIQLKVNGYDVVSAFDGLQGVSLARREKPDLIILDINLPAGDGFTVANRLKLSTFNRDTPVIFLTAVPETEKRAYKAGARFYFKKPYDPKELFQAIKTTLET